MILKLTYPIRKNQTYKVDIMDKNSEVSPQSQAGPSTKICPNKICHQKDITDFSTCRYCGAKYDMSDVKQRYRQNDFNFGDFIRKPSGYIILLVSIIVLGFCREGIIDMLTGKIEKNAASTIKTETDVLSADPQNYDALIKRGDAYWATEETKLAFDDYSSAIKANPALPIAYEKRAIMYDAMSNFESAKQDRQTAKSLKK